MRHPVLCFWLHRSTGLRIANSQATSGNHQQVNSTITDHRIALHSLLVANLHAQYANKQDEEISTISLVHASSCPRRIDASYQEHA
jgi:hypothetical protein